MSFYKTKPNLRGVELVFETNDQKHCYRYISCVTNLILPGVTTCPRLPILYIYYINNSFSYFKKVQVSYIYILNNMFYSVMSCFGKQMLQNWDKLK